MTWPEDGKRMFEGAWPTCPREHGDGEAPEGCICTLSGAELMARIVELEAWLRDHGGYSERCDCEGCDEMVPGCWESSMCTTCLNEDCEHGDPGDEP